MNSSPAFEVIQEKVHLRGKTIIQHTIFFVLFLTSIFSLAKGDSSITEELPKSLINFKMQSNIILENGVSASITHIEGKKMLKIATDANPNKGPAVYLISTKVQPGVYTYFVKGIPSPSCRVLHYITHSKGNLIWPGADMQDGISKTIFTVPDTIHEITLALSFLYPTQRSEILLEDIALFSGALETWPVNNAGQSSTQSFKLPTYWMMGLFLLGILSWIGILYILFTNGKKSHAH